MAVEAAGTMAACAPDLDRPWSRALSYLIVAFLAEGIVGKLAFGRAALMPQFVHLLLSAAAVALLIALAATRNALGGRALVPNADVRALRLCVGAMILWGLLSSIAQVSFVAGNLIFWSLWAANLAAVWWAAPRLLQWDGMESRLRLIGLVLGGVLAAAVLLVPFCAFANGRFGGPFANPTMMGRVAVLASLFWFAQFLARGGRSMLSAALWLTASVALALTRTRASLAAAAVGLVVCLAAFAWSADVRFRLRAARVAAVGLFSTGLFAVSLLIVTDGDRVADFLRIRQDAGDIYSTARAMNWDAGVERLHHMGFFGGGFLSKFAPEKTRDFMGVVVPTYDWTTDSDPLNSVLGTCQQTGWVGGGLFVLFLALLVWRSATAAPRVRPLLLGLCAAGLVWGLFDGNWLTSFGDPIDRICMVTFALLLSVPQQAGSRPGARVEGRPHAAA